MTFKMKSEGVEGFSDDPTPSIEKATLDTGGLGCFSWGLLPFRNLCDRKNGKDDSGKRAIREQYMKEAQKLAEILP